MTNCTSKYSKKLQPTTHFARPNQLKSSEITTRNAKLFWVAHSAQQSLSYPGGVACDGLLYSINIGNTTHDTRGNFLHVSHSRIDSIEFRHPKKGVIGKREKRMTKVLPRHKETESKIWKQNYYSISTNQLRNIIITTLELNCWKLKFYGWKHFVIYLIQVRWLFNTVVDSMFWFTFWNSI